MHTGDGADDQQRLTAFIDDANWARGIDVVVEDRGFVAVRQGYVLRCRVVAEEGHVRDTCGGRDLVRRSGIPWI
jgi:hypothetical protein